MASRPTPIQYLNTEVYNLSTYVATLTPGGGTQVTSTQFSTLSSAVTDLQTFSSFQVQTTNSNFSTQLSTLSSLMSTATGTNTSQGNAISALETFSSFQVQTTNSNFSTQLSTLSSLMSTATGTNTTQTNSISSLQLGLRRYQQFGGLYSTGIWGDLTPGTSKGTSTMMIAFASTGQVALLNNTSSATTTLPLYIGAVGAGYAGYPVLQYDNLRFAHIGVPGSNSSIIINLVSSATSTQAIELSAGEVINLVYGGANGVVSSINPASYYYFPTL